MKTSLFGRVAQEGLEAEQGMDTDITIPEGGDTGAAATGDTEGAKDDDQASAGGDAAKGTVDGGEGDAAAAGTGGDDTTTGGTDDTNIDGDDEDGASDPIEFPDVGNLNVDQVAEVEEVQDKLADEQDKRVESVEDAAVESTQLVAAVEGLLETLRAGNGIGPVTGRSLSVNLASARARMGFPNPHQALAMESFMNDGRGVAKHTPRENALIALEGFRSTLRAILEAIVKAIHAAIDWVKKYFRSFFGPLKQAHENTVKLGKAVLKQREGDKEGVLNSALVDDEKYVSLSTAQGVRVPSEMLRINGQVPADYAEAFTRVLETVEIHDVYRAFFDKRVPARAEGILQAVATDGDVGPMVVADPMTRIIPKTSLRMQNLGLLSNLGMQLPQGLAPESVHCWYVNNLLGNVAFVNFLNKDDQAANLAQAYDQLGTWRFVDAMIAPKTSHDNSLRYMSSEEITKTNEVVINLEKELLKFEATVDAMTAMEEKLRDVASKAAAQIVPMSEGDQATTAGEAEHAWKGPAVTAMVTALNNTVTMINKSLVGYQQYGVRVCQAWNLYLNAILVKEAALLKEAGKK